MSAEFNYYDLGRLKRGATVVVELSGSAANVRLLDQSNFASFRRGGRHRYFGGLAKRSPIRIGVPHDGHWYVTVDLEGLGGSVRSGVRVEGPPAGPLPEIREPRPVSAPLTRIAENVEEVAPESPTVGKSYDVFISHASEDKDAIVRDLARALENRGLQVWYDEFALRVGDRLRRKVDTGLATSRFGVVVLSPSFFKKNWPQYELDGLVTREMTDERQIILPLWHGVSREDVAAYSPSLADKVALQTSDHTIEEIASEIADVIAQPT